MSTFIGDYPILASFGVLAADGVVNTGNTAVQGNVGVSVGTLSAITGFYPTGTATGTLEAIDTPGSTTVAANTELTNLIIAVNAKVSVATPIPAELGGQSLGPGAYIPSVGTEFTCNGTLTLTGGASDQFFFIATSTITFAASSQAEVTLLGVDGINVFWLANSSLTVKTSIPLSGVTGFFLAANSITLETGISIKGALYARDGAVTLDDNSIKQLVICYAEGTKIFTKRGYVPVEDLDLGDMVMSMGTIDNLDHVPGAFWKPVVWTSKFTSSTRTKDDCPIRIKAHAFGNAPFEDLYVSPLHRIILNNRLVEARALVNGDTIVQEYAHDRVTYYHIELDTHSAIVANGLLAESYLDVNNRKAFEYAPKYVVPTIMS
jgi:hypothetical protein